MTVKRQKCWLCERPVLARGVCHGHYKRWRRYGDPRIGRNNFGGTAAARLWRQVEKTPTCWLWVGPVSNGYGVVTTTEYGKTKAHRLAYELLVGKVPDGLDLDHLCRVRRCVNPAHVEPVTRAENLRRRTHCPNGHEYTADNTDITRAGRKCCRLCADLKRARRREKYRAAS